jgi:type II secretory pathway pseudopilin PulG
MSMIEVLFAIGVIAVGLLGLFSVFISGTRASAFGANVSRATGYCRDVLEIVRSRGLVFHYGDTAGVPNLPPVDSGLNDAAATRTVLNATPPTQNGGFGDLGQDNLAERAQFTRNIRTERMTNDPNSHLVSLFRVTVTIYWEERGIERSVTMTGVTREPQG